MPALTSKRASAALGDIRREFDRRRKLAAVATGRVEKKSSSALSPVPNAPSGGAVVLSAAPIPRKLAAAAMIKKSPAPIPHKAALPARNKPAGAGTKKPFASPRSVLAPATAPPFLPSSPASDSKTIKKGSTVLVRTQVGALPSGMGLVLWLSARVVSDAEDGYLEVMYNGDFPRDDPFRTVRVARDQVKSMPPQQ